MASSGPPTAGYRAGGGRATPPAPARAHRRDAAVEQLPRPQGRRHRPRRRYVAGDLLPVLPRGRVGHPRAGRGDGPRGPRPHRHRPDGTWKGQGRVHHRRRAGRRVHRLLGGPPVGAAGRRPGHRGGRSALPQHPHPAAERGRGRAGRRHRRGCRTTGRHPADLDPLATAGVLVPMLAHVVGPPVRLRVLGHPHRRHPQQPWPASCTPP